MFTLFICWCRMFKSFTYWWWPISFSNVSPSAWNLQGQADMIPSFRLSFCFCTIKCFSQIHKCLLSLLSLLCLQLRPSWQLNYNVTGIICTCDCQWDEQCVVSYSQFSGRPSACGGGWIGWSQRVHGPPAGAASWTCRRTHEWPIQKKRPPPGLFSTAGANPSP